MIQQRIWLQLPSWITLTEGMQVFSGLGRFKEKIQEITPHLKILIGRSQMG